MTNEYITEAGTLTHIEWPLERFWLAYETVARLPDICPTGFVTTYVAVLVMMPVILYVVLVMAWSMASIGPARKTMTTVFILILGVPLYPVLAGLLLATMWIVLGIASITFVTLGPIFLVAISWINLLELKQKYVDSQRGLEVETGDIKCLQLLMGLVMGILCFCTFGVFAFACTILKAPILLLSGFFQAWWHGARAWLKLVECPCCYSATHARTSIDDEDEGESASEDYDGDIGACNWWYWFPLVLAAWLIFVSLGLCVAVLAVCMSALLKLACAALWPAYVTAGWLRYLGPGGTRRRSKSCLSALTEGLKAGYQVVWASDVLTNTFIIGDIERLDRASTQFMEIARGERQDLAPDCRRLSCFPPVVVGVLQSSWDLAARGIAEKLGIAEDEVEEAWRSLARQMIRTGRAAVEDGLLTTAWVMQVPSELCIGLPARTILDTLERSSTPGEIVLSSGLVLREADRPRGGFFDEVWDRLMEARDARAAAILSTNDRACLCAALLAGGGNKDELPPGLGVILQRFEMLPAKTYKACQDIVRPLIALSLQCSRKAAFKGKLQLAIQGITDEDGDAYLGIVAQNSEIKNASEA